MTESTNILVVDDEDQILRMLRPTLEAEGYAVDVAETGAEALATLRRRPFAAVILDLGLPDMDGKEVISRTRAWSGVPIIVLSARGEDAEKIAALDLGAEDYLAKPFSIGELLARLRVLLRPAAGAGPGGSAVYETQGAKFNFKHRSVTLPTGEVKLSGRENEFLRLLAERRGDVVSHKEIILSVWGDQDRADAQFVRVLAGQVRQKIEADPSRPTLVLTVPGLGYRLA